MIVVLTYNVPHRKTQDLLFQLKIKTDKKILVLGSPMKYTKKHVPLIKHRPSKTIQIDNSILCSKLGFMYEEIHSDLLYDKLTKIHPELILVAGAGILDSKIANNFFVVNCHPGILPDVRGLDALKWAIYYNKDIGITLHLIDQEPDSGYLIKQEVVPIYKYDTFHSVAYRLYEMEVEMLANSIDLLKNIKSKDELCKIDINNTKVNNRMDYDKEKQLYEKFMKKQEIFI